MTSHDDEALWPPGITAADGPVLDQLAAAGIGEGDFTDDHGVPAEMVELHEAIEQAADQ